MALLCGSFTAQATYTHTSVDLTRAHTRTHTFNPPLPLPPTPAHLQANAITGLGQPALLYLCPLTLGAVLATAASRRDLGRIWSFTDTTAAPPNPKQAEAGGEQQQQERQQEGQQ
jgi:hypothetical protein